MKKLSEGLEEFDFFEIDNLRLNEEWIAQPRLYFVYAVKVAEARAVHEQAKAELDLCEAELDGDIRNNPSKYGIDDGTRVTNPLVAKMIQTQKEYLALRESVAKKRHRVEVLQAAVSALDHRKKALENLVQLEVMNYHSEPRAPKGAARDRMADAEKRSVYDRIHKKSSK